MILTSLASFAGSVSVAHSHSIPVSNSYSTVFMISSAGVIHEAASAMANVTGVHQPHHTGISSQTIIPAVVSTLVSEPSGTYVKKAGS